MFPILVTLGDLSPSRNQRQGFRRYRIILKASSDSVLRYEKRRYSMQAQHLAFLTRVFRHSSIFFSKSTSLLHDLNPCFSSPPRMRRRHLESQCLWRGHSLVMTRVTKNGMCIALACVAFIYFLYRTRGNRAKHLSRVASEYTQLLYHVTKSQSEGPSAFVDEIQWVWIIRGTNGFVLAHLL